MGNRVLVVDDAAFMRMMIKDILEKMDMKLLVKQQMVLRHTKNMLS